MTVKEFIELLKKESGGNLELPVRFATSHSSQLLHLLSLYKSNLKSKNILLIDIGF